MASVYLCEDLKHDRRVVLKLLKPELAAVLGVRRFVQEIKTTAPPRHPRIVPVFDSLSADGFAFQAMPGWTASRSAIDSTDLRPGAKVGNLR